MLMQAKNEKIVSLNQLLVSMVFNRKTGSCKPSNLNCFTTICVVRKFELERGLTIHSGHFSMTLSKNYKNFWHFKPAKSDWIAKYSIYA